MNLNIGEAELLLEAVDTAIRLSKAGTATESHLKWLYTRLENQLETLRFERGLLIEIEQEKTA